MTSSLVWAVALIKEWLSIVVNFGYGSLLWYYYFNVPWPSNQPLQPPSGAAVSDEFKRR